MSGLEGLGVLNSGSKGGTVETPTDILHKNPMDSRLFEVDCNKFESMTGFADYTKNWFTQTGVMQISDADMNFAQSIGHMQLFNAVVLNDQASTVYTIAPCYDYSTAKNFIQAVSNVQNRPTNKIIVIAYFNFNQTDTDMAKSMGIELFGYDAMYDVNNAITSSMTYLSVGSNFYNKLAKQLNNKYKSSNGSIGSSAGADMSGVGNDIASSFKEGFEQLKGSITGLFAGLGSKKNQPQQTMVQPQQTMVDDTIQEPDSNVQPFVNNDTPVVSIDKVNDVNATSEQTESTGVKLEKNSGVELGK